MYATLILLAILLPPIIISVLHTHTIELSLFLPVSWLFFWWKAYHKAHTHTHMLDSTHVSIRQKVWKKREIAMMIMTQERETREDKTFTLSTKQQQHLTTASSNLSPPHSLCYAIWGNVLLGCWFVRRRLLSTTYLLTVTDALLIIIYYYFLFQHFFRESMWMTSHGLAFRISTRVRFLLTNYSMNAYIMIVRHHTWGCFF